MEDDKNSGISLFDVYVLAGSIVSKFLHPDDHKDFEEKRLDVLTQIMDPWIIEQNITFNNSKPIKNYEKKKIKDEEEFVVDEKIN